jgi:hypothetical protein
MADEPEAASAGDRPVDPPIIDIEAEEVEKSHEAPPEQPTEEVARPTGEKNRLQRISLAAVLAGAAILIACASFLVTLGTVNSRSGGDTASLDARLQPLATASEQIQAKMDELTVAIDLLREQSQRPPTDIQPDLGALKEQLQRLEDNLGSLSQRLETIGGSLESIERGQSLHQDALKSAMSQIGNLQTQVAAGNIPSVQQQPAGRTELAADFLKLKTAVEEGRPFGGELARLNTAVPKAAGLQELASVSAGGAITADLAERLRQIVTELKTPVASETTVTEPQGIWDTFKSKAASLVSVRKLDDARWLDAADGAVARVDEGDLSGAVKILRSVEGKPPAALQSWLEEAETRLKIDKALEDLSASVLKVLGGGS